MKTHTLAKLLLEGPDVLVVHDIGVGYAETETDEITVTQPVTLWKCRIVGEHWSDMSELEPVGYSEAEKLKIEAVKLA